MKLRIISLLATTVVAIANVSAAIPPTKLTKDITWEYTDDGVLKVYGIGEIPDFKNSDQRKAWRKNRNEYNNIYFPTKLRRIEIGEGITRVGEFAFYYLPGTVEVSLPSSLKALGTCSFGLTYFDVRLPENLETIEPNALENITNVELEIPASVKYINGNFNGSKLEKVVIKGNPIIYHSFQYCKNLREVEIQGNPTFENIGSLNQNFKGCPEEIVFIVPDGFSMPSYVLSGLKNFECTTRSKITENEKREKAEATVSGYVAYHLPSWETYVGSKIGSDSDFMNDVKIKVEDWQQKGEFEPTPEWQARVNETTRKKYIDKFLEKRKNQVLSIKNQYEADRVNLVEEFYEGLKREALKEYADEFWSIQTYDADNQTYLVKSKNHGDILLNVPIEEAQQVKAYWQKQQPHIDYTFLPKDESSVVLTKMTFKPGNDDHIYTYTGQEDVKYALADIDYNFAPIEIEDIKYDSYSIFVDHVSQSNKTINTTAIESKTITPDRQNISVGGSRATVSLPKASIKSDIDTNIPKTTQVRDNTFALVIANENYRRVSPVTFALNDGIAVARHFEIALGIPAKNIITVNDASLNDIQYNLHRLSDICEAYKGKASVIVYYAGHGVPDNTSKEAFLLPVDGYAESVSESGVSLAKIMQTIEDMPTRSSLLLLDACFSGASREGTMLAETRGVRIKAKENQAGGNLVVFSASQGDETAHPYIEQGHGMFTYFFLKKLGESCGDVTLGELSQYVQDRVIRASAVAGTKQTPTVCASPKLSHWENIKF